VVKLFRQQFEKDFELFLTLRYKELVSDGRMVLTFASRKRGELPLHVDVARVWELLSEALQHLVQKVNSIRLTAAVPCKCS
jgi:jasmonate O-methyltransferase